MPVDGREHELTLYMEDTMWPYEDKFIEYIDRCGEVYAKSLDRPTPMLTIEAAFQPALGSHLRREVTLMQRIHDPEALLDLLRTEIPARVPRSGDLDARRPGPARPVDQPAAADLLVVTRCTERAHEHRHDHRRRRGRRSRPRRAHHRWAHHHATASWPRPSSGAPPGWPPRGVAGERVAVVDVGSLLSIATMLGAARIGAAAALMNPALTPPELRGLHQNAGCAEVGVAGEAYADRLREAGARQGVDGRRPAGRRLGVTPPCTAEDVDDRDAPGPVHQRHDRAAEGDRHHQRPADVRGSGESRHRSGRTRHPRSA